ncbi:MAG: 16S rRNA (uracil(1498)-N(3))-methyltransferase [Pseudomonadota bacterium]
MSKNLYAPRTRIYVNSPLIEQNYLPTDEKQAHYLATVLRLKIGDKSCVFNGKDGEFIAEITEIHKKSITIFLKEQSSEQRNSPDLWLLSAPLKNSKAEFIVEKATELGISCYIPVKTRYSIVSSVNEDKLVIAAIEASEQCERLDIPEIKPIIPLMKLLSEWDNERIIIYGDESGKGEPANIALSKLKRGKYAVLIGPEGGFSEEELILLESLPFAVAISMGERIMRADTATIAALALVQSHLGDWENKPKFRR